VVLDFVSEKVMWIDLGRKQVGSNKSTGKIQTEVEKDKVKW
jgi:hypothetical protein